ncbi:MAG: GNAT family N-acetyltransferase [Dehalococcoidia bacterium]|nr:GNAT family N-acetyltransferase [Dehalococcoidia bacterium]
MSGPAFPEVIETDHYRLRRLQPSDAGALLEHFSHPEVTRYLDIDPLTDLAGAIEIVEWATRLFDDGAGIRWAILDGRGEELLGTCGFNTVVRERASRGEVAYDLKRAWWGRGVMREVMPALLSTGYDAAALNRLEAFVTPGNVRSTRLLERHGFRLEGRLREYARWRGRDWDQLLFVLIRSDWVGGHQKQDEAHGG